MNGEITAREHRRCSCFPSSRDATAVRCSSILPRLDEEKEREAEWNVSLALPVLGIGAKRIIKELKVLKLRCILTRDVVLPAT